MLNVRPNHQFSIADPSQQAIACGGAIILAVGTMWVGQKRMKETTGQASLYSSSLFQLNSSLFTETESIEEPGPGKDQNMSSGQISDVVTNGSTPSRSKAK